MCSSTSCRQTGYDKTLATPKSSILVMMLKRNYKHSHIPCQQGMQASVPAMLAP